MKTLALTFASVAAASAAFSYSGTAHALGPIDIEIAGRVGFASNPSSDFGTNPLGFGLGARAGVSIFGLYGGVSGMYYFASSDGAVSYHSALEGFEAGYTLPIPVVKIRPQIGVGNATYTGSVGGFSSSNSNLYLEPGVLVFVPFGHLIVGADINALVFPGVSGLPAENGNSKTYLSVSFHAQVGVRF